MAEPDTKAIPPFVSPVWRGDHLHASCYDWVGKIVAEHGLAERSTIEIGSGIVNGTIRDHFKGAYIGVDLALGAGVDRVEDSEHLSDSDTSWFNVVSVETLEHVRRPWLAIQEMARICQQDGSVILSARGYDSRGCWEVHAYPHDYWRFSIDGMRMLVEDAGLTVIEAIEDSEGPGVFLYAVKQ